METARLAAVFAMAVRGLGATTAEEVAAAGQALEQAQRELPAAYQALDRAMQRR